MTANQRFRSHRASTARTVHRARTRCAQREVKWRRRRRRQRRAPAAQCVSPNGGEPRLRAGGKSYAGAVAAERPLGAKLKVGVAGNAAAGALPLGCSWMAEPWRKASSNGDEKSGMPASVDGDWWPGAYIAAPQQRLTRLPAALEGAGAAPTLNSEGAASATYLARSRLHSKSLPAAVVTCCAAQQAWYAHMLHTQNAGWVHIDGP